MEQTPTEFPCCLWDGWDNVQLGDDGLPLIITRDNISTWFEWNEIPMPENPDGLSDADLIVKLADPLKAKSCYRIISYPDALHFSHKNVLETLKDLGLRDWNDGYWDRNGCFSHYPPDLRKIIKEFARGAAVGHPAVALRNAIHERDEEIARKVAEEEAKAKARQETHDKIKAFLDSIGDFEMPGEKLIRGSWEQSLHGSFYLGGSHGKSATLNLDDGYEANVKVIIDWAVRNGAREPKTEAS